MVRPVIVLGSPSSVIVAGIRYRGRLHGDRLPDVPVSSPGSSPGSSLGSDPGYRDRGAHNDAYSQEARLPAHLDPHRRLPALCNTLEGRDVGVNNSVPPALGSRTAADELSAFGKRQVSIELGRRSAAVDEFASQPHPLAQVRHHIGQIECRSGVEQHDIALGTSNFAA